LIHYDTDIDDAHPSLASLSFPNLILSVQNSEKEYLKNLQANKHGPIRNNHTS